MSRKSKLTPDIQTAIVQALSVGATHRIACEFAGIVQETFYTWLDKGRAGKQPYVEFLEQVTRTQGRTAVGWLAKIEAAANEGDWRAVAWKLERRYPEEFGRTVQEHHGPQGGAVQIEVVYTSPRQVGTSTPPQRQALPQAIDVEYAEASPETPTGSDVRGPAA